MFGLSRTKTVKAQGEELSRLECIADFFKIEASELKNQVDELEDRLIEVCSERNKALNTTIETRASLGQVEERLVILERRNLEANRVGTVRIDTHELQSKVRNLASSVKIEGPMEPQLWVIKSLGETGEKEMGVIKAAFQSALEIDRT